MGFNYLHNKHRRRHRRRPRRLTVKSLARKVRELEIDTKPERKFIDDDRILAAVDLNTATIATQILNTIPQGTGVAARIGDKVTLSSIQLDYWISSLAYAASPATGLGTFNNLVRFIVAWFPGVGEVAATDVDIRNVLEANNAQSFYRRNGQVNFKVLHDKTYELEFAAIQSPPVTPTTIDIAPLAGSSHHHRCIVPLKKKATYSDAAGTVEKGTLVYYCFATPDVAGSLTAFVTVKSRLTYEDE